MSDPTRPSLNDSLRAHNGCHNFPKDHSRYISALKTFVYVMPTFSNRGVGVREASVLVV